MALENEREFSENDEARLIRRFVGTYTPDTDRNFDHAAGFEQALITALDVADRESATVAGTFQASVTFEAKIIVGSPGNVGEYKAIVTELP